MNLGLAEPQNLQLKFKMPTADLEWSSFNTGPIFQVFGTKRKASEENSMETHNCVPQNEQTAKRRCDWQQHIQQHAQPDLQQIHSPYTQGLSSNNNNNNIALNLPHAQTPCNNTEELNHNSPTMQDQQELYEQQQYHHMIAHPGLTHVMSQQPPRVPSPWPLQQPFQHTQTDDHIMDLNEGTYSPTVSGAAEMDAACSTMDSDCAPNPGQYTSISQSQQELSPSTEFCKNYCGSGEKSPNSGRIRCFCKPSWEGMLDMKPYISDVY